MAHLTAWHGKYVNKQGDYVEKWQKYVPCLSHNISVVPYKSSHNKVLPYFWPLLENMAIKNIQKQKNEKNDIQSGTYPDTGSLVSPNPWNKGNTYMNQNKMYSLKMFTSIRVTSLVRYILPRASSCPLTHSGWAHSSVCWTKSVNIRFLPSNAYWKKCYKYPISIAFIPLQKFKGNQNAKYVKVCNTIPVRHYIFTQDTQPELHPIWLLAWNWGN